MGKNDEQHEVSQAHLSLPIPKRQKRAGDDHEQDTADGGGRDLSRSHSVRGPNGQFVSRPVAPPVPNRPVAPPAPKPSKSLEENAPARHGNRPVGVERVRPAGMLPSPGRTGGAPNLGGPPDDSDLTHVYLEYERPCRFYSKLLRRRETRPLFLHRNLSYKICAKRQHLRRRRQQRLDRCRVRVTITNLRMVGHERAHGRVMAGTSPSGQGHALSPSNQNHAATFPSDQGRAASMLAAPPGHSHAPHLPSAPRHALSLPSDQSGVSVWPPGQHRVPAVPSGRPPSTLDHVTLFTALVQRADASSQDNQSTAPTIYDAAMLQVPHAGTLGGRIPASHPTEPPAVPSAGANTGPGASSTVTTPSGGTPATPSATRPAALGESPSPPAHVTTSFSPFAAISRIFRKTPAAAPTVDDKGLSQPEGGRAMTTASPVAAVMAAPEAAVADVAVAASEGGQQAAVGELYVDMRLGDVLGGAVELAFYVWEDHPSYELLGTGPDHKVPEPSCPMHKPRNVVAGSCHASDNVGNNISRSVGNGGAQRLLSRSALGGSIVPPGASVMFAQVPLQSLVNTLADAGGMGGQAAARVALRRGILEEAPCPPTPESQQGKGRTVGAAPFLPSKLPISAVLSRGPAAPQPRGGGRKAALLRFVPTNGAPEGKTAAGDALQVEFDVVCTVASVPAVDCICPGRTQATDESSDDGKVMFYFWYKQGERTWAQATQNFSCPFCGRISYGSFMGLVSHLVACHDRFDLHIRERGDGQEVHVIEVAVAAPHLKPLVLSCPNSRMFIMHKDGLAGILGHDRAFASSHVQAMLANRLQMGTWADGGPSGSEGDRHGPVASTGMVPGDSREEAYERAYLGQGPGWPTQGPGSSAAKMGPPGSRPLGPPRPRPNVPLLAGAQGGYDAVGSSQLKPARPVPLLYDGGPTGSARPLGAPCEARPGIGASPGKRVDGGSLVGAHASSSGNRLTVPRGSFAELGGGSSGEGSGRDGEFGRRVDDGSASVPHPGDRREGPPGGVRGVSKSSIAGGGAVGGGAWPRPKGTVASASAARPPRPPAGDRGGEGEDRRPGGQGGAKEGAEKARGGAQADKEALRAKYSGLLKRRLYHSRTALPMTEEDIFSNIDSDDEEDEEQWRREQTLVLDEFPDLSASEKSFMLLWNTYFHKHPLYADMHCPVACYNFAVHSLDVIGRSKELRRCFMLHLTNLWDLALIDSKVIDACLRVVDGAGAPTGNQAVLT
eukprot:jgi/Mesvir1/8917/Mv14202-RA.2